MNPYVQSGKTSRLFYHRRQDPRIKEGDVGGI